MPRPLLWALFACVVLLALAGCRRESPGQAVASDLAQRVFRPGEAARFPHAAVTLLDARREGQRLTVRLRVEATQDVSLRQQYDFELRDGAGRFGTPALLGVPDPAFNGRVAAGTQLEGHIGFDLPPEMTDVSAMRLVYRPTFAPDVAVSFAFE